MPDVIIALVDYLKQAPAVTAIVPPGNVWDFEVPASFDVSMPQPGVLIAPHGGPKDLAPLQLNYSRVSVRSFHQTPHLAYTVYWAAHLALKELLHSVWAGTYIHNVIQQSGPISGRDVTLQWPMQTAMYEVKASDLNVT
jgi:hypothetical protein